MSLVVPGSAILVTGATGGIGREIAAQAAAGGAIVGVHGSRPKSVAAAIAAIGERAPAARLIAAPGDFRAAGTIAAVVADFAAAAGRLDAVIHCAVAGPVPAADGNIARTTGPFVATDPAGYGAHAAAILGTCQEVAFAAVTRMAAGGGGTFIAFASDAGRFAAARQAIVGAAFGGIMAFVRNLAVEAARDGVRVNCLSPSFVVDTPVFARFAGDGSRAEAARRRAGLGLPAPADIAPLALFLCGPGAAKITGQVISINGGLNA